MARRFPDPLLTQEEVAEYLRKPPGTLEQWRSRGFGPEYHKVGHDVRYRMSEVDAWLEAERAARKGLAGAGRGRS
jgi:excisionase family DNA binding protein